MKKLYVFNLVTVDGYFAGPKGEIDWHNVDGEFNDFAIAQLRKTATILFGRVTYELMAGYWPTDVAKNDDPIVAGMMNSVSKIVFSTTLKKADWMNTRLVKHNSREEIRKLKRGNGKDIAIFGSGKVVSELAPTGLIDEYRLLVNPVILGKGKLLFNDTGRINVQLADTRVFKSGNVLLVYR